MPASLTLTTAIPIPNVRTITGLGSVTDDPDIGVLLVTFSIALNDGTVYRPKGGLTLTCRITNGAADGIRAKASPAHEQDYVEVFTTTTGVSTAYTLCRAAWQTSRAALMTQMQTLGLLGAGSIA